MNYEKIGEFIAEKRKEKNLTQAELAKKIGVTDKAVSKWERGLGCPDISILEVLAKELNVSVLELLKGRKIENEVIKVTEADDYVKDTFKVSTKINKEKNTRNYNIIISILIVCISVFLVITNIRHYLTLTKKEDFRPHISLTQEYDKFVNNYKKIDELKNKMPEKYFEDFKLHMSRIYENYNNDEYIRLNKSLTKSEFYFYFYNHVINRVGIPAVVQDYKDKSKMIEAIYNQYIYSRQISMSAGLAIENFYNRYFFKPIDAGYKVSNNTWLWVYDDNMYIYYKYHVWSVSAYLEAMNTLFDVLFEGGLIYE